MEEIADWTSGSVEERADKKNWIKYAVGGVVIIAAIVLLIYTSTQGNTQYFLTVEEIRAQQSEWVGKDARVSGVVLPETIQYDASTLHLEFLIVDEIGSQQEPLRVVMDGEPLPDQMQDEAQAIAEGRLDNEGNFNAEALMMKCASKYDVEIEEQ